MSINFLFQHTAARRRLGNLIARFRACRYSFNTQPPEGGWHWEMQHGKPHTSRFNTQPPEGGWVTISVNPCIYYSFNTQPPEGGWDCFGGSG